ncbi:MAG: response regulator transcription factor [Sinobacteraceae bacterium]|nr:response regulator transcription factor [Nevskiaceae bacterium]
MLQNDRIRVLIAHDDPLISAGLVSTISSMRDFEPIVKPLDGVAPGMTTGGVLPDVAIADYDTGLQLIVNAGPLGHRVIILTHSDSEAQICNALEAGARGYILVGCSLEDLGEGLRSVYAGEMALGPVVASRMAERMKQKALTGREADILRLLMLGMSNKAIANKLTVAVNTVKAHVQSILEKLDARSRTQAVSIAQRRGILT